MATTDDTVRLHPNRHDFARAMRAGRTIPLEIPRTAMTRVVELKAQGLTFHAIAEQVPEVISPDGAHVAFREALNAMPVRLGAANTGKHKRPRWPFDGRPGAPAWTPNRSALADTLRPLEHLPQKAQPLFDADELRAAGVPDGCQCWHRDDHGTIILAGNLWCPLHGEPENV